jgi:hypothetical protein
MSKRIRIGLGVGALAGLVGAVLLVRTVMASDQPGDPEEGVYATLQITSYRPSVLFDLKEPQADFRTYLETQAALLKSRMVLNRALLDPKVAALPTIKGQEEPSEWLSKAIQVQYSPESMIVRLSLDGGPRRELAVILNAVVDAYMTGVIDTEFNDRLQRLQHLEKLYGTYQDNLKTQRDNLRTIARSAGKGDGDVTVDLRKRMLTESLSLREKAALEIRLKLVEAETLAERRKDPAEAGPLQDQIAILAAQRKALEEDRRQLLDEYGSLNTPNPDAVDLENEQQNIALTAETAAKVGREIEALKVELQAPRRVQVVDSAKP